MIKVSQLMDTAVPRLQPELPILGGIEALARAAIGALPVVNDVGRFVGLLRERDVMPIMLGWSVHDRLVADFMCRRVVTFSPDDAVLDVCDCIFQGAVVDCPVVDKELKFLGMLLPRALIDLTARLRTMPARVEVPLRASGE